MLFLAVKVLINIDACSCQFLELENTENNICLFFVPKCRSCSLVKNTVSDPVLFYSD